VSALVEMRPEATTDAHQTDGLAELVCTSSFKSAPTTSSLAPMP
jgi:methylenetetrahydrofolate--tRNA-(uracil-5-)-methyltransferase